jgi:hypothetical protein
MSDLPATRPDDGKRTLAGYVTLDSLLYHPTVSAVLHILAPAPFELVMPANPYESPIVTASAQTHTVRRRSAFLTLLGSLAVMLPWPALGIGVGLAGSIFEQASDFMFFFGSATLLLFLPFFLGGEGPPEVVIGTVIVVVWCSVLILPALFVALRRPAGGVVAFLVLLQSIFALAQAALGLLMILGRSV